MTGDVEPAAPALRIALRTLVANPPDTAPDLLERALRVGRTQVRRRRTTRALGTLVVLAAAGSGALLLATPPRSMPFGSSEALQGAHPPALGLVLGPPTHASGPGGVPACTTGQLRAHYRSAVTVEHGRDSQPGTLITLTVVNTEAATCSLDNNRAQAAAQLISPTGAPLEISSVSGAVAYPALLLPPRGTARWTFTWLSWCAARPQGFRVGYNDGFTAVTASRVFPAREVPTCSAAAFAGQNPGRAPGVGVASTWSPVPGGSPVTPSDWSSPAGQICLLALPTDRVVSATPTTVGAIRSRLMGPPSGGSPDAPAARAFPGASAQEPGAWCWTAGSTRRAAGDTAWGAAPGYAPVEFLGVLAAPGPGRPAGPPSFP